MSYSTRNTHKSRMLSDISDTIVSLVLDGNYSPSKKAITERLTKANRASLK